MTEMVLMSKYYFYTGFYVVQVVDTSIPPSFHICAGV